MARAAVRAGLGANQVTLIGFGIGAIAMVLVAVELYLAGLVALLFGRVADGLDGAIARLSGVTDLGGFLDVVLDFIFYSGIVFAFALADPQQNALPAAFLVFSFVGTGTSFLAYAIVSAKRGLAEPSPTRRSFFYVGGLAEGTETILVLVLFCLMPGYFPVLATGFGILCWVTTASRIALAWRTLR
jgi:phosphatidylglycerophosphate synthase